MSGTDIKKEQLLQKLQQAGKVCVAFSSGVDSSFLLEAAFRALGQNVLAVMAVDAMVPGRDLEEGRAFCGKRGIPLVEIDAEVFSVEAFSGNTPERCYHCKKNIFTRILATAHQQGIKTVVEGSNADDTGDWRPGMKALKELGIQSPMLEVGLTKQEIRGLAKEWGVEAWDKPAGACLATRIPFGTPLTGALLARVEQAEYALMDLGYRAGRVRVHGDLARIELPPDQMTRVVSEAGREPLVSAMRTLGFLHVCLDLEGYVKGSMNRAVQPETQNSHADE